VNERDETDKSSGLLLGSEPLKDVKSRNASGAANDDRKDSPKGDDDGTDSDGADSDTTDKKDKGDDSGDTDGKD
jgi:hypothetical protein